MALKDELRRSGEWLFRRRSYVPVVFIAAIAAGMQHFAYPLGRHDLQEIWCHVCLLISLTGLAIRSVVVGYTPEGTSGRNSTYQLAQQLNTTGMYSLVRHPLYLGNFFIWLGISLFPGLWWFVLIYALLFWLYYERIMYAEEEFLEGRFGVSFRDWAARTPAFFPRSLHWQRPALPFSFRNVLRREYTALGGIFIAFALLELGEHLLIERKLRLDPEWQLVGLFGIAQLFVLRFLKRHTLVLHVEGR
jgi:protein-S-isoprenylcysteine O-methyltransferase Ste14